MKAQRLILKDGSSTGSNVAASQGRLTSVEWAELEVEIVVREEDGSPEKGVRTFETRPAAVMGNWESREDKEKAIMTKEGTSERNPVPSVEVRVSVPSEKLLEVLTVLSDTEEYRVALEKK